MFILKIDEPSTTSVQCLRTAGEEENSYNLDEITSQFIEDETKNLDKLPQVSENAKHNNIDRRKMNTNFTKVLDISGQIEKNDSNLPSSRDNKQKRQKNKQ